MTGERNASTSCNHRPFYRAFGQDDLYQTISEQAGLGGT